MLIDINPFHRQYFAAPHAPKYGDFRNAAIWFGQCFFKLIPFVCGQEPLSFIIDLNWIKQFARIGIDPLMSQGNSE
ncbi:hypothetical protein IMCC21224_1940 [Puniceibacterium sp. IMCC21224]|nr:hypothetical protein IMCC21224_1940 [Puniceibacterium sp. IMCC21224]